MAIDEGRNRREAFRQDELLPMREEPLTPEQFEEEMNRTGIITQNAGLMEELINSDSMWERGNSQRIDPEIAAALGALELKLNYLIAMNLEKGGEAEYEQRLVNLSATGIGFATQAKYDKGDRLKIRLNLPMFPPVRLELLGEVVSATPEDGQEGSTRVGVSFVYRCAQEEDAVVKYLFKRQRERIRTKYQANASERNEEFSGLGI